MISIITTGLGYILAALILFIILFFIALQNLLNNQNIFNPVLRFLCRLLPAAFGIRVRPEGLTEVNPGDTYIFMSNHVNIFDGFILYGYIPNFVRGVELEDHFSWPVWGNIIRRLGNIPISHKNPGEALQSLKEASLALEKGTSIVILPEGHRTRNGSLQPFMKGPFRLAGMSGASVVPIAMKDLWERKSKGSLLVRPGSVNIKFGSPIPGAEVKEMSENELRTRVRKEIEDMLSGKHVQKKGTQQ